MLNTITNKLGWLKRAYNRNQNRRATIKALSELNDFELNKFLRSEGWVTIKADNPYVNGYYFNMNSSGSVAGDHLF